MKTILLAALIAGGTLSGWLLSAPPSGLVNKPNMNNKVGNDPGNIRGGKDIVAVVHSRHHELATFAGGCFWGFEQKFRKVSGVVATAVGYTGGAKDHPTYEDVCTHTTGHAEAVLVEFDPKVISYEALIRKFFEFHDPTQVNRQGPDVGTNYRSHIFTFNDSQVQTANKVKSELDHAHKFNRPIATVISPAATFWMAEEYHQQYNEKNGIDACPI